MAATSAFSRLQSLALVCAMAVGLLALWLLDPIALQSLRLAQFDQFQRWHPRAPAQVPVRVIDIDEASLQAYGQWPWPRTRVAELVERLHEAGAAAIALDVILAEPDRTSPATMAQLWNTPQVSAALAQLPDHDAVFARTLVGHGVVLGFSLSRGAPTPASAASGAPKPPYRMVSTGAADPARWLSGYGSAVWPLPGMAATASGLGALNYGSDSDGVVRRVPLLMRLGDQMVPSLSAEALRVAQNAPNYVVRSQDSGVQDVRVGNLVVPTNPQAEIWLHYTADASARFVSASQVLQGTLPADLLDGHIVLVGSSAAGLMDLRANPLGHTMPGVQAHVMALEQMLSGEYLQRPSWAKGLEAVVLALGVVVLGWAALAVSARRAVLVLGVLLALLGGGAWAAFVGGHYLLDASTPGLAMLLSFGLASGVHHRRSENQQRWLRTAFSRYVSPNRVAHILAHPQELHLGGQRQACSFVFTDLAGFTAMMEAYDPAQVVSWLNDYLEGMLEIAFRHEGTLDRFVGDAMAVLFSAPVFQADHRQRALDCAVELDTFSMAFANRLQAQGVPWGLTRIGVHCGEVIVGNFGGKTLFDYRALGDPINTAARLESVNKHLGTRVCVSQEVLDGCTAVATRHVGRLVLKGKTRALQVNTPVSALDANACAPEADYARAMQALCGGPADPGGPQGVLAQWQALALRYPHDPLVRLHAERVRQGATDDLIVMTEK